MSDTLSGVGVLDKAVAVLDAVASEAQSLPGLVRATGLSRATAHRIAVALERHRLVGRDAEGRFVLGARVHELAGDRGADLVALATPVVERLRDEAGESAQLYVRRGDERVCLVAAERPTGLRDSVPVGAVLPLTAGSGGQVLLAWAPAEDRARLLRAAAFTEALLAGVRRRGWAQSVAEREAGVASVSAPVFGPDGAVVAALCLSGPVGRLGRAPGRRFAHHVSAAAATLSDITRHAGTRDV